MRMSGGKGRGPGSQRLHAIWMGSTPGPANDYIQTRVSPRLTVIVMACAQSYTTPLRTSDKLKFYKFDYLEEGEDVYKRSCVGKGPALLGGF